MRNQTRLILTVLNNAWIVANPDITPFSSCVRIAGDCPATSGCAVSVSVGRMPLASY